MAKSSYRIRLPFLLIVVVALAALYFVGRMRLSFETDIIASLPHGDPVVADARAVLRNHPIEERIAIDVAHRADDPAQLVAAAEFLEERMRKSGLFKEVGLGRQMQLLPELAVHVTQTLPALLSEDDLEQQVAPLLTASKIRESLAATQHMLGGLEGIGQARLIAQDPLGLRNGVLARMAPLAPASHVVFQQGQLLSEDKKHLLLVAEPASSGYDTALAAKTTALFADIATELNQTFVGKDTFELTPVGAYRASLDNETTVKADTNQAVWISTLAIALLLLVGFPRPWMGILALPPALAGTVVALFVYSLIQRSISLLAVGFGGAVISFTVDYGIAYLLFLDRQCETRGLDATREVWSLGLLAMLTTAVSFLFLFVAGFPALSELGLFAALGVVATYLFVHLVYPFIFVSVPPARRRGVLPLQRIADWVASGGTKVAGVVALFGVVMAFWARPVFRVDLNSMNTVTAETLAAEQKIRSIWGDVMKRVFLEVEGSSLRELQARGDRVADHLEEETKAGVVGASFVPSMLFPGEGRAKRNFDAWRAFWTPDRVRAVRTEIDAASEELGFAKDAFEDFDAQIRATAVPSSEIPTGLFPLLGISQRRDDGRWQQFSMLEPGPRYAGAAFYQKVTGAGIAKVFDPAYFAERLGALMLDGFVRISLVVGAMTFLVAMFYLVHVRLTLLALAPTLFSLICTIATLRLLGRPLGVPVIMVGAVVIGMGTDYALYLLRAYQRYLDDKHPSVALIRLSTLLSFATTLAGFGTMALARHGLLQDCGLALTLGIGYCFLGTVTLVPSLARRILAPVPWNDEAVVCGSPEHLDRTRSRYRNLEAFPRLFARFKLNVDPLFAKLASFVGTPRIILDIGTGFGVPAAYLLGLLPKARLYGIEPDKRRVEVAGHALGKRATIEVDKAPNVPHAPEPADAALFLDVSHYLSDEQLLLTLTRLRQALREGGRLVMRSTVPSPRSMPLHRRIELFRLRMLRLPAFYRALPDLEKAVSQSGFRVVTTEATAPGREETWIVGEAVSLLSSEMPSEKASRG